MKKTLDFLTVDEISQYLRIPKSTIYKYTMVKKIPCIKVGKQIRFKRSSIDKWVEKQEFEIRRGRKKK